MIIDDLKELAREAWFAGMQNGGYMNLPSDDKDKTDKRGYPIKSFEDWWTEYLLKKSPADVILPCGHTGCINPHELKYRGCDKCKYKIN